MKLSGITLRPAQEDDLATIVHLERLAFAPLKSNAAIEQAWYEGTLTWPGRSPFLAVDESTGLGVGTYTALDLALFLEGQVLPAMGVASVAVAPHKRGQRLARLMLEHALGKAQAQKIPLVMLYPFQHGFYRKLGWAWVGQSYQYRVSTRHLPVPEARTPSLSTGLLPYDPAQQQQLQAVYQQAATRHNGWLERRDWQWEARLKPKEGREIYTYSEAGELLGYVMFQFVLLEPPQNILAVVVQEWVALTPAAYRGILGLLASLRDQVSTVVWNTDAVDPFPHLLREQRRDPTLPTAPFEFGLTHRFGEIGGGFMWRLVDLQQAFEQRPIQAGDPFVLTFQVQDPILGAQMITVEFADRHMHCREQAAETIVRTSIEHLTELWSGFRRATDLLWTGELELEGDTTLLSQLDRAWQATPPFCWDFF